MAYVLRAYYEQESNFAVTDRIEIYEDGFSGTEIQLGGEDKAFKFEHREITSEGSGGILSVHDNQIMMGVLDFFPRIDTDAKKTLIQDISDADRFDFQVRLVRDGTTVWYGYPSGRVFSYPERPSYFASLQFKDFEVLQTEDFTLEDNRQHIITTLADLFSYTQTTQSIYTVTSFQEENTTLSDDFLNQVYHDTVGLREYGSSGDENDVAISVWDALIHASEAVLLIKQWDGFRVDQLSGYADPSAVLQSEYNASGVQQSSTSVDVRQTINSDADSSKPWMKVSSENDTYPSVHKAKVFFNHRTSESGIQVPSIVSLEESTAETGLITASTGSTNVSGSGTSFLSDVAEGDTLWVPQSGELRELGEVASVTDNTNLILTTQANYNVTDSEWHIDATETGRYSQEFSSDGTQRIRLATTVRVTGNFGTTQIFGRYRIKSGSYWYNKTTDGWTNSGEVINEFRARGTTTEVSGSIALETSNIPDAADGTLELTLFIAEDQNDSSQNVDVTTYEDTTFAIRENTAAGNSNGIEHELTQTGGFDTYDFGEDWYGDGVLGAVYLPANYRHGTGTTDVTENSWRRRGETTFIGFHELKLREVIDFQRSRARKIYGQAYGEIDPNKAGVYEGNNYFYAGGVYDGRWQPRYMRINEQTSSSDEYINRLRVSDSGGGGGSSSTVGSGGLTESEADGFYFRQDELLSEASDLPTLRSNIGLGADDDVEFGGVLINDTVPQLRLQESDESDKEWRAEVTGTVFRLVETGTSIAMTVTAGGGGVGEFEFFRDILGDGATFSEDMAIGDTLTINSQLLFTEGSEQLLSTDASPTFAGLTSSGQIIADSSTFDDHLRIERDTRHLTMTIGADNSFRFGQTINGIDFYAFRNASVLIGTLDDQGFLFDVNGTSQFRNDATFSGDVEVNGLLDAETIQTQTLRTTLFKPTTISGMGGEIAFSAVSTVVSIDTGANTIVVEDAVFANGDSVVVSSAIFNQSGFSNVELNITSAGSAVSGGTEYSYTVNSGDEADIDTGDSVTRVNGDLVYINATKGSGSPRIAGFDNLTGFADSPLSGDTATAVWELNPTGGTIAEFKFDLTHFWTEDGSQTAGTFTGINSYQSATTKTIFSGGDDKDGTNAQFYVLPSGEMFHPSIGELVISPQNQADFSGNSEPPSITDDEWETNISRSSDGTSTNRRTKKQNVFRKRFSADTITIAGIAHIDAVAGSSPVVTDHEGRIYCKVTDLDTSTTAESFETISNLTATEFSFDLDISTMTDGNRVLVEIDVYAEVDISSGDGSTYSTTCLLREDVTAITGTG